MGSERLPLRRLVKKIYRSYHQMMKIVEPTRFFVVASNHRGHLSRFLLLGTHIAFIDSSTSYSHPFIIHPPSIHSIQSTVINYIQFQIHHICQEGSVIGSSGIRQVPMLYFFSYSMFNVSILYILILLNSSSHDAPHFPFFHTQHSTAAFP